MMKSMMNAAVGAALLLSSMSAEAAETSSFKWKGEFASAALYSYDDCRSTSVYLQLMQGRVQSEGAPEREKFGSFYLSTYDFCTGESEWASGEFSDFRINAVHNASLHFEGLVQRTRSIPCPPPTVAAEGEGEGEGEGECGTFEDEVAVDLDLDWRSTGEIGRGSYTERVNFPGGFFRTRSSGAWSDATLTGSLIYNDVDLLPESDVSASLNRNQGGDFVLVRY